MPPDEETTERLNTHGVTMNFGKHNGKLITRVPVGYLRWMVNSGAQMADYAKAELDRRRHVMPEVEISGHAIDTASLRVWKTWQETREKDEGLHAWLMRMTLEAIADGERVDEKIRYRGMKFVVVEGEEFPALKSIMPD